MEYLLSVLLFSYRGYADVADQSGLVNSLFSGLFKIRERFSETSLLYKILKENKHRPLKPLVYEC